MSKKDFLILAQFITNWALIIVIYILVLNLK